MKKLITGLLVLISLSLISCKSSFTETKRMELTAIQKDLESKSFEFQADAAFPFQTQAFNNVANDLLLQTGNNANRINLQGNNYSVQVGEKKAQFNLPFYGERRLSGGYNGDNTGFDFTSAIEVSNNQIIAKNGYLSYKFKASNKTESVDVELMIYSLNSVNLSVNSSHRTFMKYEGTLIFKEIE
ncbi:uncharacterized protein DUF4251 [Nonlabens dokdonensis]|uniref:DUF4251 domain-containing protein n=2 Tax=Nonlabens dokdonensis TaxID=328515 RepID=L7WDD6_NONDD|nr:DUF4251 domain-containing protein [Nonlabens dokdonensis]AGC78262.1 hypothetical protein DDD_3135 [Nonlabens dokdonensis DSW-6]PZX37851.1 uncharacterized protein DUF4251 [Nonlabens dokdonensis]